MNLLQPFPTAGVIGRRTERRYTNPTVSDRSIVQCFVGIKPLVNRPFLRRLETGPAIEYRYRYRIATNVVQWLQSTRGTA